MKNTLFIACVIIFSLGILGCKTEIKANVFSASIKERTENKESGIVYIDIVADFIEKGKCKQLKDEVVHFFARQYGSAKFVTCKTTPFDNSIVVRVPAPIEKMEGMRSKTNKPIVIGIFQEERGIRIAWITNFTISDEIFAKLQDAVSPYSNFEKKLTTEYFVTFHNDEKTPINLIVDRVFVDGKPVAKRKVISLRSRESINISLSNLANDSLNTGAGQETIAILQTK